MDAEITNLEAKKVACIRHLGPYIEVGGTWHKLCSWAGRNGLLGRETQTVGICHDDPEITPPDKIRYDACLVLTRDVTPDSNIVIQEIPGGRYVKTTHQGPYTKLNETYSSLFGQWMPAHDIEPAAGKPSLEFYLNDPNETPEEQLLTDIYVPLD